MEYKQSPSKKKSLIHDEKLIRDLDYDSIQGGVSHRAPKKPLLLEISQKGSTFRKSSQKVLVSIKPRAPAIKTIYIAEKRFHSKKHSEKSGSRLAIGDHSSFAYDYSEEDSSVAKIIPCISNSCKTVKIKVDKQSPPSSTIEGTSTAVSKCATSSSSRDVTVYRRRRRNSEKCYMYTHPHMTINVPKLETVTENSKNIPYKTNIGALVVTNSSSDDTISGKNIESIHKRIDWLEQRILRQEMVLRTLDPNIQLSSTEEETENEKEKPFLQADPGCSYVEYSHIPETSAFQRYAQPPAPLSPSKATTIQKEHNSEQYGRDFTLYDGITARGRRQCASVPCKRDDIPKLAAERVHKIRHKLNPVRDYRLMDTVHYLAQGEFAPRDDGIKLTPSREAVLSDIIWEDVCRTHWPNTRLGRRITHPERYGPRSELQRLIDSLLRERVAHVERRRRRHYRIVKLNNRHEHCRAVGKTGDIIVASNKNRPEGAENGGSDTEKTERHEDKGCRKESSKSHLIYPESRRRVYTHEECTPGPSHANRSGNKQSTCCYRTSSPSNKNKGPENQETNGSSVIASKCRPKQPKLVIKKSTGRSKFHPQEPNLEHYILLPTLVIRTPSNVKRQKKFNELYHKILNKTTIKNEPELNYNAENPEINSDPNKKNIGLNINITLSESEEKLHYK
ncbi:uncharacterized protein LOC123710120 [Pieris brassicae]|uniref:uncharacterized protein LOC123710120 n=1 Tax=Pieris brassicae TaxID=7116 RepID=UPI001E660C89|nr:uncharacterized protein LOC123710120 [Pieris brassicae]